MDANLNRNSMGSRAGTSIKPKFGAGGNNAPAPSRQGTAGRVPLITSIGIKSSWRSWLNCRNQIEASNHRWRYQWSSRRSIQKKCLWPKLLCNQIKGKNDGSSRRNHKAQGQNWANWERTTTLQQAWISLIRAEQRSEAARRAVGRL